jgi:hypothetical protein
MIGRDVLLLLLHSQRDADHVVLRHAPLSGHSYEYYFTLTEISPCTRVWRL